MLMNNANKHEIMKNVHRVLPYASRQVAGVGIHVHLVAENQDIDRTSALVLLEGLWWKSELSESTSKRTIKNLLGTDIFPLLVLLYSPRSLHNNDKHIAYWHAPFPTLLVRVVRPAQAMPIG